MFHILLLLIFLLPSTESTLLCSNSSDCQALLKFKAGITDDPHDHLLNWNEKIPFCNWTGISCFQFRVIAIKLNQMDLQGTITPFVSNLSLLTSLSLQQNRFHGDIPSSIGELGELEYLNISHNILKGLPRSISGCQNLEFLDLEDNFISGVPEEVGWLQNLKFLSLSTNGLIGSIPVFLTNLTTLNDLELAQNSFTGKIPDELGAMRMLEILYLHVNTLEGSIPSALSNCTALREVALIENLLSGEFPEEIGKKLINLEKLYVADNKLSGRIPTSIANLSRLTLLDLSINRFEGQVPDELGTLKSLENLYLHSNYLVSNASLNFLTVLGNCSHLRKLHLASNDFAGTLPASIGDLSKKLYYLNMLNNLISGDIPDSIGNLTSLVDLTLWYNFLDGKIPRTMAKLTQLQRLYLGRNRIRGSIPNEMGQLTNLGLLDLSQNQITGSVPLSMGNLSQLRYLYLAHNNLSGGIPVQLARCTLLMLLDLSYNKFTGNLPTEIGNFSSLDLLLNISNNNLHGEIPASIGELMSAEVIDLSKNNLSGSIPSSFARCISLKYFNLSNNKLEGVIPSSLEQIKYLEVLDFSFNQLTGSIPTWSDSNTTIKIVNFSYNRLTGEIPKVGRFKNLNRSSLLGNGGLCGVSATLNLHPCPIQIHKKKSKSFVFVLSATLAGCVILTLFLFFVIILRKIFFGKRTEETEPAMKILPHTFTQRELELATSGFNEDNLIGRGSFGSVYKATMDDETVVAVKVLNRDCIQSYKSLKRECEILSGIKHRNLVKLVGSSWTPQLKALVTEYINNGNLEQHLYPDAGTCGLTLKQRLRIAIDIASALEYLHDDCSVPIIHCDLKPQNILLDVDFVAHVADFGIGKLILADNTSTSSSNFLRGSIGYIPPEYGQGGEVSSKADAYSYGILLLELITCRRPTDEAFGEGHNLRTWVRAACPSKAMDVVDMALKEEAAATQSRGAMQRLEYCCIQVVETGMMCTEDNPQRRPSMSSIKQRLNGVWRDMEFDRRRR